MLLDSDYPFDKIIFQDSGSFSAAPGFTAYIVNHNLPFTPLMKGVWSTDPNFSVTYNIGDGVPTTDPFNPFSTQGVDVYANSTQAVMAFIRNAGAAQTVYIRMWGLMPSTVSDIAPMTSSGADNFTINSDYNYTKLLLSGVTLASSSPGTVETVAHNLGYYPQTDVWAEHDGNTYLLSYTQILNGLPDTGGSIITTNDLRMHRTYYPSSTWRFHYRIYKDAL